MALLEIRGLALAMRSFEGEARVLNGIDLAIDRNEIWGLVGETGCGKSLTGLSISRLVPTPPARYLAGSITFDGRDLFALSDADMRALRGRRIGMIFQDPTTNLNPVFRIGDQMVDVALATAAATLAAKSGSRRRAARALAIEMLGKVGIAEPEKRIDDYPHEFSGGMRQRVLIAMALIGEPDLLIADEPTTALDVTVQAQVLRLMRALVRERGIGVLLITHNLGVVARMCTHVAVMYAGNIVESGSARAVFKTPRHPYTRALLAAVPRAGVARGALEGLPGVVPNLLNPPTGCRFAPRCRFAAPACGEALPPTIRRDDHAVACLAVAEGRA